MGLHTAMGVLHVQTIGTMCFRAAHRTLEFYVTCQALCLPQHTRDILWYPKADRVRPFIAPLNSSVDPLF